MEKSNIEIRYEKKGRTTKSRKSGKRKFLGCVSSRMPWALCIASAPNDPAFVPELDQSNGKCSYETDKNLLDDYLKWFCEENAIW
mgnify:CR=1 FL=1